MIDTGCRLSDNEKKLFLKTNYIMLNKLTKIIKNWFLVQLQHELRYCWYSDKGQGVLK